MFELPSALPADWQDGTFIGRVDLGAGPSPIVIQNGRARDISRSAPTVSQAIELGNPVLINGEDLGPVNELGLVPPGGQGARILSPIDLQAVKASGVTFAVSALERVIEESARGDPAVAASIRSRLEQRIGAGIKTVVPGSPEAEALKAAFIEEGVWSQYLEVAIGPYAEIFTKSQPLSTVGWGAEVGVRPDSAWNNPEPEVVLIVNASGRAVGATLGNDVNLRDIEGRSALLLGKAKDNNASCSLGPLIRLFDEGFTMDDVRAMEIALNVSDATRSVLDGSSSMKQISRDPDELIAQTMSEHCYPDGFALFLGTLFAPSQDRDEPGLGFTHKVGDIVRISTPLLGTLENRVATTNTVAPWTFGIGKLMSNLAARGLLGTGL
ncbi:MAG: fumarylacetoacetate hydrolase family protein [Novosphingobium sp.]